MTVTREPIDLTEYPESDGQPMTESDPTRDYLIYAVAALNIHFRRRKNVYVSGNLFVYYRQGDNRASVSPDVFVVFGVPKRKRRSYFVWQEKGKVPQFVLELTSKTTRKQDEEQKPKLYAALGVQEYFQYDPTGDYLQPQLKGYELIDGQYQLLPSVQREDTSLSIYSKVLGLDLRLVQPLETDPVDRALEDEEDDVDETLAEATLAGATDWRTVAPWKMRFFDPQTGNPLLTHEEAQVARTEAEQARLVESQAREQAEQAIAAAISQFLVMGMTVEQIAEILKLPLDQVQRLAQSPGN